MHARRLASRRAPCVLAAALAALGCNQLKTGDVSAGDGAAGDMSAAGDGAAGDRPDTGASDGVADATPAPGDGGTQPDRAGDTAAADTARPLPFEPSHIPAAAVRLDGADVPDTLIMIDTGKRQITLEGQAPRADANLVDVDGKTVWFVGGWTMTRDLTVKGSAPLIVVAARAVDIRKVIHAEAVTVYASGGMGLVTPGPGGGGPGTGAAPGVAGQLGGTDRMAGGGGGFGTPGGRGGARNTNPTTTFGNGGIAVGGLVENFVAGSGGGAGDGERASCGANRALGGAGGGAIQITSFDSITIRAGGGINAGGSGGIPACSGGSGGGGGGSGGLIFLEAARVAVQGILAANGGGGGSGMGDIGTRAAGADATLSAQPAPGGHEGTSENETGFGGAGAAAVVAAGDGTCLAGCGGGGGGAGRIWLRVRAGGSDVVGGVLSPPAVVNVGIP